MTNKKSQQLSSLPTSNGETGPYFQTTPSRLGEENAHLKNWRFPNGQPPNVNEAWFSGRDAGVVWAACDAEPAELEGFLCLYGAEAARDDDFNSLVLSPARDYLRVEVTYGRKGWICSDIDLAKAFTEAFIEAVLSIGKKLPAKSGDRHGDDLRNLRLLLN